MTRHPTRCTPCQAELVRSRYEWSSRSHGRCWVSCFNHETLESALECGWRGDIRPTLALRETLDTDQPESRAAANLLDAQLWFADPSLATLPTIDGLAPYEQASAGARALAWRASMLAGEASVLGTDKQQLARWCSLAERLGPPARLLEGWRALAEGQPQVAIEWLGSEVVAGARERIVQTALKSFALLALHELSEGLAHARRACRMANAEEQPQAQYLAYLALARGRRLAGHPHLALRILRAMEPVVSAPWKGTVNWELATCGEHSSSALSRMLDRLARDDEDAVQETKDQVLAAASSWAPWHEELRCMLAFLGLADEDEGTTDPVDRFLHGEHAATPGVLSGLVTTTNPATSGVLWRVGPSMRSRRVAGRAGRRSARIAGAALRTDPPGRTELGVAILSGAGPALLSSAELFSEVYGFAFRPEVHGGTLRTLKYRMRKWCEGLGSIDGEGDRLALHIDKPVLFFDPRCRESLVDRMLRFLASTGGGTTRDAAARLGITERTAQRAVKELSADGSVISKKLGSSQAYVVVDTTFHEPTRWR